ncbi:claspin-like [Maniola hyperantus]|uniref:claspin-like n=1 Tax=Aphantopus hyperantus TaxID=2795564 RepID=UPI001569ED09|nr:uncharacterized protein LOC117982086 [Maniola hyperantus]
METVDDNFAWTDASTDSSRDTDMVVDMKQSKSKRGSDRGEAHNNESHGEPGTVQDEKQHREKKRKKHAIYEEVENDNSNHRINQSIKSEPNSDFDLPKDNKKRLKRDKTSASSDHQETFYDAEDYLNLRVKQEQATFVEPTPMNTKKKKKHKEEPKQNEDEDIEEHNLDSSCLGNGDHSLTSEIDISNSKKKKKKKKKEKLSMDCDTSEILEDSEDSPKTKKKKNLHEAEDYLNLRVKQEQATFVEPTPMKMKNKKKHNEEPKENQEQELELSALSKDDIDIEEHNLDSSCLINGDHSLTCEIDISNSKRKKKKKKEILSMDGDTSDILEDSEDQRKTKKKRNKDDGEKSQISSSKILSSTLIQDIGSIQENGREQHHSDVAAIHSSTGTSTHKSSEVALQTASRISDRIRFEEDSVDYEPEEDIPIDDVSTRLQQFISSNVTLQPLQVALPSDPSIGGDDEVWLFKVPHDICVDNLVSTNLTLDGKKKVKINGNTYDTEMDLTVGAAPILVFNKRKAFIKNIPLKGVIHLHKRIPKIHIPYESLMMSTESSFVPLPDTKCRHPLFGARYESAARVPPAAAARLRAAGDRPNETRRKHKVETESDADVKPNIEELRHSHRKKRKMKEKLKSESDSEVRAPSPEFLYSKKKKRKSKERLEFESASEARPSVEVLHSKKKKKKNKRRLEMESDAEMKLNIEASHSNKKRRKHSEENTGTQAGNKAKRVKREPAWDSELAIEKNLFDF